VEIANTDWHLMDDLTVWTAAGNGVIGAADELRRRTVAERTAALSPSAKAAMASRARNGRPIK
jgi:hypothetical protein